MTQSTEQSAQYRWGLALGKLGKALCRQSDALGWVLSPDASPEALMLALESAEHSGEEILELIRDMRVLPPQENPYAQLAQTQKETKSPRP